MIDMSQMTAGKLALWSELRLTSRHLARSVLQAWLPSVVSLGSLWLLGFPGLGYFQMQQALLNSFGDEEGISRWVPITASVLAVALLGITLSAWSMRLMPSFYAEGQRADMRLLAIVLVIGMGPAAGFAACTMGIASLSDIDPQLRLFARVVAGAILLTSLFCEVIYYRLSVHQRRHRSRNFLRLFPLLLFCILLIVFTSDSENAITIARGLGPVALFAIAL
jgi:hypothetical protein